MAKGFKNNDNVWIYKDIGARIYGMAKVFQKHDEEEDWLSSPLDRCFPCPDLYQRNVSGALEKLAV